VEVAAGGGFEEHMPEAEQITSDLANVAKVPPVSRVNGIRPEQARP
jgi:hypothetical protein